MLQQLKSQKTHFGIGTIMVKDYSNALLTLFIPELYQRQW